jgi:hypothetical protein
LSDFGDIPGSLDSASLEMHFEAVIECDWTSTWRLLNDGTLGAETLFISELTYNYGNVKMRLNISALIESWLMAFDYVGWFAGNWNLILGSTCNHENEENSNNLCG